MTSPSHPWVVALVPAKDRADLIGDTVRALHATGTVDQILVIDDGSADDTAARAAEAGAGVLRLPHNVGKGGAVTAGVEATPEATIYLMVDADTATTAATTASLVPPILTGDADMTIAVPPSAGSRGGFGWVKRLSARGIERAVAFDAAAPLSGQRAIDAPLMRRLLPLAPRFGLETAMTIDALEAGARVREIEVLIEHLHTGRSFAGFRHRAGQGVDIVRALWPRLTGFRTRVTVMIVAFLAMAGALLWSGTRWEAQSQPAATRPTRVVIFGMPHLDLTDVGGDLTPSFNRLVARGAVGAMSVRTYSNHPSSAEAYATLAAGVRVHSPASAGQAYAANGGIAVPGARQVRDANPSKRLANAVDGIGRALAGAKATTAVVGNADQPGSSTLGVSRPAALALVNDGLVIPAGSVGRDLLEADDAAPGGFRASAPAIVSAVRAALPGSDAIVVDPGDLDRAAADGVTEAQRHAAILRTDAILGQVAETLPEGTLLIAASLSPSASGAHLTPVVVVGPGVPYGYLHSPSTKRAGIVTLTDLGPTVLDGLVGAVPHRMVGQPLRYQASSHVDLGMLRTIDRDGALHERIGNPITVPFVTFQVIVYLFIAGLMARRRGVGGLRSPLRFTVLAIAALPLASLLFRLIPGLSRLGPASVGVLFLLDFAVAAAAGRLRRHPLSALLAIMMATMAVLIVDVATGVRLLTSSYIGYALSGAGRFYGLGNAAFAVLSVCALLTACIHVRYAPRRKEALLAATLGLGLVMLADMAPTLGDDVGGVMTLVPVFGLTLWVLWGRRLSWRPVAVAAVATVAVLAGLVAIDSSRAPERQTHLAHFFSDVRSGGVLTFWSTLAHRGGSAISTLGASFWTAIVPLLVVLLIYFLLRSPRWNEVIGPGALRTGAVAAFACGLIGFAANDSGVIVIALVFVFVGPYLALVAFDSSSDTAILLPPNPVPATSQTVPAVSP